MTLFPNSLEEFNISRARLGAQTLAVEILPSYPRPLELGCLYPADGIIFIYLENILGGEIQTLPKRLRAFAPNWTLGSGEGFVVPIKKTIQRVADIRLFFFLELGGDFGFYFF